jgi:hypothetical protein
LNTLQLSDDDFPSTDSKTEFLKAFSINEAFLTRRDAAELFQKLYSYFQSRAINAPEDMELLTETTLSNSNAHSFYNLLYISCQVDELRAFSYKPLFTLYEWLQQQKEKHANLFRKTARLLISVGFLSLEESQSKLSVNTLLKMIGDSTFYSSTELQSTDKPQKLSILKAIIMKINLSLKLNDAVLATSLIQEAVSYYREHFSSNNNTGKPNSPTVASSKSLYKNLVLYQVNSPLPFLLSFTFNNIFLSRVDNSPV